MESNSSFLCQRCLTPLQIDPSLTKGQINEHTKAELALPDLIPSSYSTDSKKKGSHEKKLVVLANEIHFRDESGKPAELSHGLRMAKVLFDLVSDVSSRDHPLCEECADSLLEAMDSRLKSAEEEAQEYQAYLKKLENEDKDSGKAIKELGEEYQILLEEEETLKKELEVLKEEEVQGEDRLKSLIQERQNYEKEENRYWREYYGYTRKLLNAEDDYRSLDCQFKYAQKQLDTLKKTNVYNATFHIWHTGHFATINGFRLGRLPSVPVEWPEINAAWGQTALLLSCLSKKIGMTAFHKYQIVPYGSFSYIKVLADEKELPLYGAGGFRMIWDTKFDSGMAAFLDCLSQFIKEIEKLGFGFNFPYEVDKEKAKIRDKSSEQFFSIKLQFNSEDSWTKALRYMLTSLKWALAFVSTKYMRPEIDSSSHS
ncbi:beclin-1-like protein [Lepeophtheirus salmonis]|uniref:beclin-1-like protein n=1 Tax=Lepeophtheirus salmonis TaxID=72036 RepID=UPI001AE32AC2|nr:beclin-1-like protein [Lepeophtheirus salmonis]